MSPLAPPPRATMHVDTSDIDALLFALPEHECHETQEPTTTRPVAPNRQAADRERQNKAPAQNVQERVRNLSVAEQQKVARTGEQPMRVALERVYGKAVWESLLRNPRLTPPEVLRIARMASLTVPLLELILGNRGWLANPQIRRALLSNRRLTKDMVNTVLRATPKSELKIMHRQTAYPPIVRETAAKMIKGN